uniref:Immunoglobulin I-set domain-containing protein n=1 Tax=Meloidogyne incognita TaxID=6306 RepID=A0A914LSB7_MELIC
MANQTTPIFTQRLVIFGNPEVGSPVHFDTRVQLHDHMNIFWYRDHILLEAGGRFVMVNNNGHLSLSIFNAVPADSGLYCVSLTPSPSYS